MNKSFTLIELLIVIGILAILVVTILITLNPSEAQKKARDAKRMKDLATLQAIILQYISDGGTPFCTSAHVGRPGYNGSGHCESFYIASIGSITSQPCNNSWLTYDDGITPVNLCNYSNTIPAAPLNNQYFTYVSGGTIQNPTTSSNYWDGYWLGMSGSDYKIGVKQESRANAGNLTHDASGNITSSWAIAVSSQDAMSIW